MKRLLSLCIISGFMISQAYAADYPDKEDKKKEKKEVVHTQLKTEDEQVQDEEQEQNEMSTAQGQQDLTDKQKLGYFLDGAYEAGLWVGCGTLATTAIAGLTFAENYARNYYDYKKGVTYIYPKLRENPIKYAIGYTLYGASYPVGICTLKTLRPLWNLHKSIKTKINALKNDQKETPEEQQRFWRSLGSITTTSTAVFGLLAAWSWFVNS